MPVERVETLIIGGGQAGLAMSHASGSAALRHLVLERHRIAERWRSERWDGLRFQFPNWSVRLPDFPFPHADPDGFATSGEIVDFIAAYAAFIERADSLRRCGHRVTMPRRRRRLRCRDLGRPDRGRQCRRRHRSLSAPGHSGGVAGRRHVPDPRQHLPQSRPASLRRRAGDRLRRLRRANHRGAAACGPPGLSLGRKPPPHAAPLSRARSDLVADRHGSRSNAGGSSAGRTGRCR